MARARLVSARGSILTSLPSTLAPTSSCSTSESAPLGPFTLTTWPSTLAVTPEGIATGFFPTRDMAVDPLPSGSEHRAEDFSAHVVVAGVVIGHHALGRGQDRNTQSVVYPRQRPHRGVDPPPRLRHPRNLPDDRLAVEIFQLDLQLFAAVRVLDRGVSADEALGLENVEHAHPQPRGRRRYLRLVAHLRIVNARNHVAERIVHTHRPLLLTSSTWAGRGSAPSSPSPAARCAKAGACDSSRAADPISRSGCGYGSPTSSAAFPRA